MAAGEGRDVAKPEPGETIEQRLDRVARSTFRARFHLRPHEVEYARSRGRAVIVEHAQDFIAQRLAPASPKNDGQQTPMGNHPVFRAQHATGTCCRGCLAKHHGYRRGQALDPDAQADVVAVIVAWIERELRVAPVVSPKGRSVADVRKNRRGDGESPLTLFDSLPLSPGDT